MFRHKLWFSASFVPADTSARLLYLNVGTYSRPNTKRLSGFLSVINLLKLLRKRYVFQRGIPQAEAVEYRFVPVMLSAWFLTTSKLIADIRIIRQTIPWHFIFSPSLLS
jgi:hypothetical protein